MVKQGILVGGEGTESSPKSGASGSGWPSHRGPPSATPRTWSSLVARKWPQRAISVFHSEIPRRILGKIRRLRCNSAQGCNHLAQHRPSGLFSALGPAVLRSMSARLFCGRSSVAVVCVLVGVGVFSPVLFGRSVFRPLLTLSLLSATVGRNLGSRSRQVKTAGELGSRSRLVRTGGVLARPCEDIYI